MVSRTVYWPRDLLRDKVPNVRILSFGYDSVFWLKKGFGASNMNNVEGHATNMFQKFEQLRQGEVMASDLMSTRHDCKEADIHN